MTTSPSEPDRFREYDDPELAAIVDRHNREVAQVAASFSSDPHHGMDWPWRIELREVWDTLEDRERTIFEGRIVPYREKGHFELRVWYRDDLVFFLTSDPREGVEDIPQQVGPVHMFLKVVEGQIPLNLLLEHANRVKNKGI